MVSSLGYALAKNSLITGFGRRHYHHVARGEGIGNRVARDLVKIAHAISGGTRHRRHYHAGSYKLSGTGTRRRVRRPRATLMHVPMTALGEGYRRRRRSTVGGYRRRRAPRMTLGVGRRRRAPRMTLGIGRRVHHRRHILI